MDGQRLCQRLVSVAVGGRIDDPVGSPAALFVHGSDRQRVRIRLDALGRVLGTYQDAVRAAGHHRIAHAGTKHGNAQLVDDMRIDVVLGEMHIAAALQGQLLRQRMPRTEVLPGAVERHDRDRPGILNHFAVEIDLGQQCIMRPDAGETLSRHILREQRHHASQPEREYAAVPECAGGHQPSGLLLRRFFDEAFHFEHAGPDRLPSRQHIAVPRGGMRRPDTHQHPVGRLRLHRPHHRAHRFEIAVVRIGVARHHDHRLVGRHLLLKGEVSRRKGDGRERLAPDRFRDNVHAFAQLVGQEVHLCRIGRHRKVVGKSRLTYLADDALYHRLHAAARHLKHRQELFRPRVIGKRPQPLARAARQKYQFHISISFNLSAMRPQAWPSPYGLTARLIRR